MHEPAPFDRSVRGGTPSGRTAVPDRRLDGNALAGPLSGVFAADLTGATATCARCARTSPLAEADLFVDAPSYVLRCRGCDGVLLRFGELDRAWHLDLSGTALLVGSLPPL